MEYLAPKRLDEALEMVGAMDRTVVAGGTDFYPARVGRPLDEPVIDISRVAELRGIDPTPDHYRIGALATWSEIRTADLPPEFDGLRAAASEIGGHQIQNVGTVGGNLCNSSPAADGIPPLLTLDAHVELASASGTRTLSLEEFLVDYRATALRPDELLTAVVIPRISGAASSAFEKLGSRRYLVISIAMVAALVVFDDAGVVIDARTAVGACSPVALRLRSLEAELVGMQAADLPGAVDPRHLSVLDPIDDPRAPASYRLDAVPVLLRRVLSRCAA